MISDTFVSWLWQDQNIDMSSSMAVMEQPIQAMGYHRGYIYCQGSSRDEGATCKTDGKRPRVETCPGHIP